MDLLPDEIIEEICSKMDLIALRRSLGISHRYNKICREVYALKLGFYNDALMHENIEAVLYQGNVYLKLPKLPTFTLFPCTKPVIRIVIDSEYILSLDITGHVHRLNFPLSDGSFTPVDLPEGIKVINMSCDKYSIFLLTDEGKVYVLDSPLTEVIFPEPIIQIESEYLRSNLYTKNWFLGQSGRLYLVMPSITHMKPIITPESFKYIRFNRSGLAFGDSGNVYRYYDKFTGSFEFTAIKRPEPIIDISTWFHNYYLGESGKIYIDRKDSDELRLIDTKGLLFSRFSPSSNRSKFTMALERITGDFYYVSDIGIKKVKYN